MKKLFFFFFFLPLFLFANYSYNALIILDEKSDDIKKFAAY